jgi:MFS family permease
MHASKQLWQHRQLLSVLLLFYFAQGLPAGLLAKAIPALAREAGMALPYIGLLGLAASPWALKFVWAPWVDRLGRGRAGHRKRWIIGCQLGAASVMVAVAMINPQQLFSSEFLSLIALLALLNLFCATQDIAADGMAVRLLVPTLRGPGNSIQVVGYKAGLILGGGALLIWIGLLGWQLTFLCVALLLVLMLWPVSRFPEPAAPLADGDLSRPDLRWWWRMLRDFWRRPGMGWWLLILLGYKVGDGFGTRMLKPMLVDAGWSSAAVGQLDVVTSLAGLAAAMLGGLWLLRLPRLPALIGFGLLQGLAFLFWAVLARVPVPPDGLLWSAALFEQCADALSTVVLFTLMMDHCRPGHEGTDYTLQASVQLMAVGLFSLASGFSAAWLGYSGHFLLSAGLCVAVILAAPAWWRSRPALTRITPEWMSPHHD